MIVPVESALNAIPTVREGADTRRTLEAAKQFEELLMRQLWAIMRKTAGGSLSGGNGPGAGLYAHLMDQALASEIVDAGGLGLTTRLATHFGISAPHAERGQSFVPSLPPLQLGPTTGTRVQGATARLQATAEEMINEISAPRWGRNGRLTREELASDFSTSTERGIARFNVRDAAGYQGRYKCNLFAFEMARRAGFQVPLMPRTHGWGYPHPDLVTADATNGRLREDWGRVASHENVAEIEQGIVRGQRAFLLTGSGRDGHAGHMAVVERVHRIDRDRHGRIERVVFDGWEARTNGAQHLQRRTWNRYGNGAANSEGTPSRNGLREIALIELLAPPEGERQERPLSNQVGESIHDVEIIDKSHNTSPRPTMEKPTMADLKLLHGHRTYDRALRSGANRPIAWSEDIP